MVEQMMSVAVSISWIARSCRPEQCVHASKIQQVQRKPTFVDVQYANEVVADCRATADRGLHYLPVLDWNKLMVVTVGDASHADSCEWIDEWQEVEPFRSQGGRLHFLTDVSLWDNDAAYGCLVSYVWQQRGRASLPLNSAGRDV